MPVLLWIKEAYNCTMPFWLIPGCFKTQGMCITVFKKKPWVLELVPDQFKTQKMRNDVVEKRPWRLFDVPNHLKMQEMFNDNVEKFPWAPICP